MKEDDTQSLIGKRIVVTGMAGAGKSTFSKLLAAQTGLPLIHLDIYSWRPGWERVSASELLATQRKLMAADQWIIDSNDVDDNLLIEHADTLIVISTPWWICSWRAFLRGWRRAPGSVLPEGCHESFRQRASDEWGIVWRNWKNRKSVRQHDELLAEICRARMHVHTLGSRYALTEFRRRLKNIG